ncbi:pentapeptide repeat-containing protein [Priestia aryabhattai]|uniref:pentapeptide repeat-containing protein n=1 Tax=Priestia aryabhattai TaxID=412384 RepID=UPI003C85194D
MPNNLEVNHGLRNSLRSDCLNCFGLCCVALPYSRSADFAFDKDGGTPCRHLNSNFSCSIHENLITTGFKGCVGYECFGAGQRVSQMIYEGNDWRDSKTRAKEMFNVFPIVQQLHEMLWYLSEALEFQATKAIHKDLRISFEETERLIKQTPENILKIDVHEHRMKVRDLLLRTSELVRPKTSSKKLGKKFKYGSDYIGAKLRRANLRGANLKGALFIAADLRDADLRSTDLIGADFRDADLSGADLTGSIFLTQAQVNAAKGDSHTKLPSALETPGHWKKGGQGLAN